MNALSDITIKAKETHLPNSRWSDKFRDCVSRRAWGGDISFTPLPGNTCPIIYAPSSKNRAMVAVDDLKYRWMMEVASAFSDQ